MSAEFVANVKDLLDLYAEPYDSRRPVVCFDETTTQLLAETQDYEYRREGVRNPIESLELMAPEVDIAVLVLSPDDTVVSRDTVSGAPRDNLVFELGLFIGALRRDRTFLLCPQGSDVKVPTDLLGLTSLHYSTEPEYDVDTTVAVACNAIRDLVLLAGPK